MVQILRHETLSLAIAYSNDIWFNRIVYLVPNLAMLKLKLKLKYIGGAGWTNLSSSFFLPVSSNNFNYNIISSFNKACSYNPKLGSNRNRNLNLRVPHTIICSARRRIRYDEEEDTEEYYGHNAEIAMLEYYTQSVKEEALVVRAEVDELEVEVLIFKVSVSLSHISICKFTCFNVVDSTIIMPIK